MWNSLLSPLSRGQGKQNGALKVVDQSEEYPVPSFLPSLVPPEKTIWRLPSRLARKDGEVVLPRTYLTRRGPLLLFTTPDLLKTEQQREHFHRGPRDRARGAESGIPLGTVDGLIESVLQFGLEEAMEEPKGKTFLRFLKGLDEKSIDMHAQPGGDPGVYLRHLKSSASRPKFSRDSDTSQSDFLFLGNSTRTLDGDFGSKGRNTSSRSYTSGIGTNSRLSSGQLLASLQSTGFYLGRPVSTAQAQETSSRTSYYHADDESDDGTLLTQGHRSSHYLGGVKVGGEGSKVKGMVRKKTHRLPESQSFSRQISGQFYELDDANQSDDSTSSSSLAASKTTSRSKKSSKKSRAGSSSSKSRSFSGTPDQRLDFDVRPKMSPQSLTITPPPPSVMESSEKEDDGNDQMKIHVELPRSDDEGNHDDGRLGDALSASTSRTSSHRQKRSQGLASGTGNGVLNKTPRKEHNDTGYETAELQEANERLLNSEQKEDGPIEDAMKRGLVDRQSSLHSSDADTVFQTASSPGFSQTVPQNEIAESEEGPDERFLQNVEALRPLLPQYTVDSLARKTSFSLQSSLPDESTEVVLEPVEVAMLPHAPREVARSRSISQSTIRSIRSFLSGDAEDDGSADTADDHADDHETAREPNMEGTSEEKDDILERKAEDPKDNTITNVTKAEGSTDVQCGAETLEGAASLGPEKIDSPKETAVQGTQLEQNGPSANVDIDPAERAAILAKLGFGSDTTTEEENDSKEEKSENPLTHKPSPTNQDSLEAIVKNDPISIPSIDSGAEPEKPVTTQRRRLNSTERATLMAKLGMADDMSVEKTKVGEAQKSPGRKGTQVSKVGSKPGSRKAARPKQTTKKKTNGKAKDSGIKDAKNTKAEVVDSLGIEGVETEEEYADRLVEELKAVEKDLVEEKMEEEQGGDKEEKEKTMKESKKKRAQELKKEQEELKQRLQAEKKRREEEQRQLKARIREKEEAQRLEEEERKRQIEDQKTAIELAEQEAEEAALMEEENRQLLAESRKKAREEREARRKAEQERRRDEAQRRREEQKQMELDAQEREERMRKAIGDAEERRRLAEMERKRRDEEERRMEEEQRAEEERLRREAEEEEERIREAERLAEEEEMRKLTKERREAEERRRLAKEEADRKRKEEIKMKFLQELKEQEEAEKRRQAELEEQQRLEEERRRRLELEQLDEERREQARLEAEQAREEEARRREHNLNMRKNLAFVRHGQEFTKPWVWSYFKNVPMEVLREPYVKEDPKKSWKPKQKPPPPPP